MYKRTIGDALPEESGKPPLPLGPTDWRCPHCLVIRPAVGFTIENERQGATRIVFAIAYCGERGCQKIWSITTMAVKTEGVVTL